MIKKLSLILVVLVIFFTVYPSAASAGIFDNFGINLGLGGNGFGVSVGVGSGTGNGMGNNGGYGGGGGGWNTGTLNGLGLPGGSITAIVRAVVLWILTLLGFIGVLGFVISGIMYLLSAGEDEMITKAKAAMKWSIVGVVVGLSGIVVIQAIDTALRGIGGF